MNGWGGRGVEMVGVASAEKLGVDVFHSFHASLSPLTPRALGYSRPILHSSNLTFSLSPGWTFVETEGWRPDLGATWAVQGVALTASVCVGADEDGWAYTTDTWTHPRPDARPCDGWVTRRRRWVRRVYFKGVER
ncbi:hypothetical protein J3R83DRAFT_5701 [Lanmaoa asiatica]|nr:hypothetical protein J3R83DRAFT_5701 [Lanmaoa asiatica]